MRALAAGLACVLLVACTGVEIKPGTKSHARREIPPGPGILTGEQGELVIFRLQGEAGEDEAAGDGVAGKDSAVGKERAPGQTPQP